MRKSVSPYNTVRTRHFSVLVDHHPETDIGILAGKRFRLLEEADRYHPAMAFLPASLRGVIISLLLSRSASGLTARGCDEPIERRIVHEEVVSLHAEVNRNTTIYPVPHAAITVTNAPTTFDGLTTLYWTETIPAETWSMHQGLAATNKWVYRSSTSRLSMSLSTTLTALQRIGSSTVRSSSLSTFRATSTSPELIVATPTPSANPSEFVMLVLTDRSHQKRQSGSVSRRPTQPEDSELLANFCGRYMSAQLGQLQTTARHRRFTRSQMASSQPLSMARPTRTRLLLAYHTPSLCHLRSPAASPQHFR